MCAQRRQDGKGRTCAAGFIYAAGNRAGRGAAAASAPAGHEPIGYECARRIFVTAGQRRADSRHCRSGQWPARNGSQADAQSSPVSSRWRNSSRADAASNDRLAAADAAPSPQPDTAPAPQPAAVAVAPAAADSNLSRQASSTQMLLVVMIVALALAGLIGAMVFRFGRKPAPPYDTSGEWRAPWDPLPAEQRASRPIFASGELPMRRPQAPAPRRTERRAAACRGRARGACSPASPSSRSRRCWRGWPGARPEATIFRAGAAGCGRRRSGRCGAHA